MASDILIIDDEKDIRDLVAGVLEDEGHETRTAGDSDCALEIIHERRPGLVFLDIWLQGSRLDGLELLDIIKKENPAMPVVMISGHGNIETAVSAIQRGAYDYIEKPFKADRLALVASRALETSVLKKQIQDLQSRSADMLELIGDSSVMNNLRLSIAQAAPTNSRVLITGPSGSGKELVARMIHKGSARKSGPFVILNAASITAKKVDEELFGSEESVGKQKKTGALEEAHRGTLYIDEIADVPHETQGKILRSLIDQNFERVGGKTKVRVDVRIISSTTQSIEQLCKDGKFRDDLFHRLAVTSIQVPSLHDRQEDIPQLVDVLLKRVMWQFGIPDCRIEADAVAVLQTCSWPGNIRQLRNNIERLMILYRDEESRAITAGMLPEDIGEASSHMQKKKEEHQVMSLSLKEAREAFERNYLSVQLDRFGGNISKTAEFINMERSALHRKLKTLGLMSKNKTMTIK